MESERGALVRGPDPPSAHSVHKTACDTWWAPSRRLMQTPYIWALLCRKQAMKNLDPSPMAKINIFQIWEKKGVRRRGQLLVP